jgi:hypothetical protein
MTPWPLHRGAFVWLLLTLWLSACDRCAHEQRAAIAKLSTLVGAGVTRDFAEKPRDWVQAELGAELSLGDGARTDERSTAELTFINGATLALKPGTTIRLLADRSQQETGVDVQAGIAELRSRDRAVALRTHLGLATIAPDSQVTLSRDGDALDLHVAFGSISFRDGDAGELGFGEGDDVRIGIGMAVLSMTRANGDDTANPFALSIKTGQARIIERGEMRTLPPGEHRLAAGVELKLAPGAEATLANGAARVTLHAGDFVVGASGALLESKRGQVSFEGAKADVTVRIPSGTVTARRTDEGTVAELSVGAQSSELAVERGRVDSTIHGRAEELAAGATRTWAHLEGVTPIEPGPTHHNLVSRAGDSFIVHAPSAPVAVAINFAGKCPAEGLVEQIGGRQASRGKGSANLAFGPGVRGYSVRCLNGAGTPGRIVARGTVQVMVDPGTRKLPPKAPSSTVEADGRTYTIYYQNQLPEVLVRWPNPPRVASYTLEVGDEKIALTAPEHLFRSGKLRDGVHKLAFFAEGRRSRTTTVEVRFDNAAPKASLSAPEEGSFAPGDLVTVEGVALPTWKVTLEGGTIAMLPGEKFTGQVQTSQEHPDVSVRLSHPRLGTHYYLRRASRSP